MTAQEIINLVLRPELNFDLSQIKAKFDKDVASIRLFLEALEQRAAKYAADALAYAQTDDVTSAEGQIAEARAFLRATGQLKDAFYSRLATLGKPQFPKDVLPKWAGGSGKYDDPLKPEREKARSFARVWNLDPKLIELLG